MDVITFQCAQCQKVMRVGADKAGRKAKCSGCGNSLTIPAQSQTTSNPASAAPSPKNRMSMEEDEDGGIYGFLEETGSTTDEGKEKFDINELYKDEDEEEDDELSEEEEEAERQKREEQIKRAKLRRAAVAALRKSPMDIQQWETIRLGLLLVIIGVGLLMVAFFLQKMVVIFGIPHQDEYAYVAANELIDPTEEIVPGELPTFRRARFMIALVGGHELLETSLWFYRISYLFIFLQLVIAGTGYGFCLRVPARYGAKAMAIALLPIVFISFILTLFLKLLPLVGAINYTMIPLVAPEVALLGANIDRTTAIHIAWAAAPFWEGFLASLLHFTTFAELVLCCIMIRAIALQLKDEKLEPPAEALIRLGLSVYFIFLGYLLLSNAGTSEPLINILRVIYVFGTCFYIWFLIWFMMVLFLARSRITKALRENA